METNVSKKKKDLQLCNFHFDHWCILLKQRNLMTIFDPAEWTNESTQPATTIQDGEINNKADNRINRFGSCPEGYMSHFCYFCFI